MILSGVLRKRGSTLSPNTRCGCMKSICISFTSRGKGLYPFPLLLSHGWPGSVFEFLELIPMLTDPGQFGGDPANSFTVVAPSLPGYGLSFSPGQPRFGVEEIEDCFASLMTDVLGYRRFGAQGGDWVVHRPGLEYWSGDRLIGINRT